MEKDVRLQSVWKMTSILRSHLSNSEEKSTNEWSWKIRECLHKQKLTLPGSMVRVQKLTHKSRKGASYFNESLSQFPHCPQKGPPHNVSAGHTHDWWWTAVLQIKQGLLLSSASYVVETGFYVFKDTCHESNPTPNNQPRFTNLKGGGNEGTIYSKFFVGF